MKWRVLILVALVAAILCGCAQEVPLGGIPRAIQNPKIVSLSPSTTELTQLMGVYDGLLGKTANCKAPGSPNAQIVVAGTTPDYEKIVSLKPDYILYDASLYNEATIEKIKGLGFKTISYAPTNFENFRDILVRMSSALGGETSTSEYIDKVRRAIALAKIGLKDTDKKAAIMIGEPGGYWCLGKEAFLNNILREIGAKTIEIDGNRFVPVGAEKILTEDPDVIFCAGTAALVLRDPKMAGVKAVKNKKVYDISPDMLLRAGSQINTLVEKGFVPALKGNSN